MNITAPLKVSKAEFYDFVQSHDEGRFEWDRGRIVQQQQGGTFDHSRIVHRFRDMIARQLDGDAWFALSDRGVESSETIRYPDVVVEPFGAEGKSLATCTPVIIVEVLSKTSEKRDLSAKPAEYTSLASLHAYVVASQDAPECWVWLRGPDGSIAVEAAHIAGRDRVITVASLGVTLPLAEIYRGIAER
jgi:Uma2 family endonuclease